MNGDTVLSLLVDCDFLYISMIKLLCLSNACYHFGYQLIIPYYFPIVENYRRVAGCTSFAFTSTSNASDLNNIV